MRSKSMQFELIKFSLLQVFLAPPILKLRLQWAVKTMSLCWEKPILQRPKIPIEIILMMHYGLLLQPIALILIQAAPKYDGSLPLGLGTTQFYYSFPSMYAVSWRTSWLAYLYVNVHAEKTWIEATL